MKSIPRLHSAVLALTFTFTALTGTSALAAKNYYKWVDDNGITHYSERKPHDREAERISVATGRSTSDETAPASQAQAPSQPASDQAADGATEAGTQVAANTKDPERCEAARQNLKVLQENARIRIKEDDGSFRFLDETEKAAKLNESQQIINEAC